MNKTHDTIKHAKELVKEGKNQETDNPLIARQTYLEAAALLVHASRTTASIDEKNQCLNLANELYQRAQKLTISPPDQTSDASKMLMKNPRYNFKDIAGMQEVKEQIRMKVLAPLQHPEVFKQYGKKLGGGLLLYGPPGCGKSLIAEATAGEAGLAFFNVKASDIKSKYVGETEKNISTLFESARREKNGAIIFFDEFESIGGERTKAKSHDKGFVSHLLTEMDGVGNKDQKILIMAATNLPWEVDIALRREGRFGTTIFVCPPDFDARKKMIELNLEGRPTEKFSADVVAQMTEKFSGADIKALCERAVDIPLREFLNTGKIRKVDIGDFMDAIKKLKATTQAWFNIVRKEGINHRGDPLMDEILAKAGS